VQRRRAQTEARIGILKHGFWGDRCGPKIRPSELALAWGVIDAQLVMLARLRKTKKESRTLREAA